MKLRIIIPLTVLLLFSYIIFVFPFETIALWLGRTTSYQETILSTAFVYLVCLYYFRSKSSNKLIKLFVDEGMGIGTISLFIIIFIFYKIVFNRLLSACRQRVSLTSENVPVRLSKPHKIVSGHISGKDSFPQR